MKKDCIADIRWGNDLRIYEAKVKITWISNEILKGELNL